MKCSYTKTCCRRVRHVYRMALGGRAVLPGESLTATYRYCAYHWRLTGLDEEVTP